MSVSAGSRLGPYLVGERLEASQAGEWFEASDASLERPVSVLVTPLPGDEASASTLRERARTLASLTDARLLPVYGQGEEGPLLWLATRKVSGRSLSELSSLEPARAARLGSQLAGQLAALAQAGSAPEAVAASDVVLEGAGDAERAWLLPDPLAPLSSDPSQPTGSLLSLLEERAGRPLLPDPPADPAALAEALAPLAAPAARSRRLLLAGALVLAVLLAAVLAVVLTRGGSSSADANAPVATETARVPLGAKLSGLVAGDRDVWATTTDGGVVHIDPRSNSVVGVPKKLFPKGSFVDMRLDGHALWVGGPGLLVRLDPSTGRVLERIRLGKDAVNGLLPSGGRLWATLNAGSDPHVRLVSYAGGKEKTTPGGSAGLFAVPVYEADGTVWTIGGDAVLTRVQMSGSHTSIAYGVQAGFPTASDGRIWAPTRIDRTVVPIDPQKMSLAPAVNLDAEPLVVIAAAGSIWALTQNPSRLYRIDPSTSRLLGSPIAAPDGATYLRGGADSLWVDDPKNNSLVRLTPTRPAPGPSGPEVADDVLRNGPLPAGVRLRYEAGTPRFSIRSPDDGWVAEGLGPSGVQFELIRRDGSGVSVSSASEMFTNSGRLERVRTPAAFLRALRARDDVHVTRVQDVDLAGTRGLRVTFTTRATSPYPKLCGGTPCVVLYPTPRGTYILSNGIDEFTVMRRGPRLVIVDASLGQRFDPRLRTRMNTLIDSIGFEG